MIRVLMVFAICSLSFILNIGFPPNLSLAHAKLLNNAIAMASSNIESVDPTIKQIVERQAKAWESADSDQIIADFTEDCLFVVPGFVFRGKQEIQEAAKSYFAEFTDTKITIKRLIVKGYEGAIEWAWSETNKTTGEKSQAEDAIVFEIENGKIKYWREYIDKESAKS